LLHGSSYCGFTLYPPQKFTMSATTNCSGAGTAFTTLFLLGCSVNAIELLVLAAPPMGWIGDIYM
jgi:hypothetical protein